MAGVSLCQRQPQGQLTISTDMAINKVFQLAVCRALQGGAGFPARWRAIRPQRGGIGVEHDHAQRIIVLPADQIGDGGFIVGAVETGLGERDAAAIVIDDDIEILRRTGNNRGPSRIRNSYFRANAPGRGFDTLVFGLNACLQRF
jgi:hypothetical protein